MSRWNKLPLEIFLNILQEIRHFSEWKKTYLQCLLVCKHWNRDAISGLYNCLLIQNKEDTMRIIECLEINNLGCLVEKLVINSTYFKQKNVDNFEGLAKLCPNITSISCCGLSSAYKWEVLVRSVDYFKRLQILPWPYESELIVYAACAFSCRNTLKTLHIPGYYPLSKAGRLITAQLEQYPNLSNLVIHNVGETARLADFDAMLDARPQLKTLDIRLHEYDLESYNAPHLKESSVTPHTYIQDLCIDSHCDPLLFEYIMRKMPNLKRLHCNVKFTELLVARQQQGRYLTSNINRLLEYLGDLSSHDITFYNHLDVLPEMIKYTKYRKMHMTFTNFKVDHEEADTQYPQLHLTKDYVNVKYKKDCSRDYLVTVWQSTLSEISTLSISTILTNNIDDLHSAVIDALFYCKNIKSVTLCSYDNLNVPSAFSDGYAFNSSLESLRLNAEEIHEDIYPFYSQHFPSLKYVMINSRIRLDDIKNLDISMPNTCLNLLEMSFNTFGSFSGIT
ncbi:hypothetical protein CU098_000076 [Rhizopus stolonifer]|uniref:F-box domain-containing protein n=1 Tax=Rhizopus stolonifer TaxID=4846 RepID=A0A367JNK1_RHIST|nr:hypothetical protein CU098_000076 [Rhizopus stolonifer]